MNRFFQMEFLYPLSEAEDIQLAKRTACTHCGLRALPFASRFPVPDDSVAVAKAEASDLEDVREQHFFTARGLLLSTQAAGTALLTSGITGITPRSATLEILNSADVKLELTWLAITGRCDVNDIWTRVASTCPICGIAKEESFPQMTRTVRLLAPPLRDVSRAREDKAGIIVSDRFRHVAAGVDSKLDSYVTFKELAVGGA